MTNILNLPGLRVLDMKELDTEFHVKAEPVAVSRMCPHCGKSSGTIGHGKLPLFVRDMPTLGKSMMIHLDAPRLMCKLCNKSFTAVISEVDGKRQMTERLVRWIASQAHDYTFATIAEQVNVDEKTVRNIFDEHAEKLRVTYKQETPRWMGIDEIYLPRARGVSARAAQQHDHLPEVRWRPGVAHSQEGRKSRAEVLRLREIPDLPVHAGDQGILIAHRQRFPGKHAMLVIGW